SPLKNSRRARHTSVFFRMSTMKIVILTRSSRLPPAPSQMCLMRVKICFACSYSLSPTSVLPPSRGRATWPEMKRRSPARMQFDHSPGPASATLGIATLVLGMTATSCAMGCCYLFSLTPEWGRLAAGSPRIVDSPNRDGHNAWNQKARSHWRMHRESYRLPVFGVASRGFVARALAGERTKMARASGAHCDRFLGGQLDRLHGARHRAEALRV